jgi:hypothetical protein
MIGAGKPRRTGADNGDLFLAGGGAFDFYLPAVVFVRGKTLQVANGDGFIDLTAAASIFAAVGADPAQHAGQREVLHDDFQGLLVAARLDHVDVALNIQASGTCQTAGGLVAFIDGKGAGYCLGIALVCRFFGGKTFLVFIRKINGADFGAFAAAGAFGKINVAGLFADPGLEASRFALQCEQFAFG